MQTQKKEVQEQIQIGMKTSFISENAQDKKEGQNRDKKQVYITDKNYLFHKNNYAV